MENTNNGTVLQACVRDLVQEVWEEHRDIDRADHEETQGGRTQGVVWPPRPTES